MDCSAWYSCRLSTFIAPVRLLATLLWPFGGHCRRHALRIFQVHRDKDIRKLRKNQASVDTRRICRSSRLVLVVAPDTSLEFGLSGPRHGKNDWPICAERHARTGHQCEERHRFIIYGNELEQNGWRGEWQPPPMNLATWPGISCAHDFQSETTETQKLLVSDEMHQKRANIREKGWKVLSDCERLFITGPRECLWNILKKGLSHFDLACKSRRKNQLSPRLVNRTSCVHSEDWCDATWRPTEVYIDFSRPPRSWKRWCLPDNGGR